MLLIRSTGSKKILEINAGHPIMKELLERVKESPDAETEELVKTLTETALINSGYTLENPHEYAKRFFKLFNGAMGISKDATVEDVEVGLDDEDEEDSNFFSFENLGFYRLFLQKRKRVRRRRKPALRKRMRVKKERPRMIFKQDTEII